MLGELAAAFAIPAWKLRCFVGIPSPRGSFTRELECDRGVTGLRCAAGGPEANKVLRQRGSNIEECSETPAEDC